MRRITKEGPKKPLPNPATTGNNCENLNIILLQMADASIEEKVKNIIVEQLGVSEDQVKPEAKFIEDLGADSLDTVELVMAFEEEFGSEISDNEAEKILTVGDAIKFIESKST